MTMTPPDTRVVAGVTVRDTPLLTLKHARAAASRHLFNHVIRSRLFAGKVGEINDAIGGTTSRDDRARDPVAGP
jgi:hypothetical protein